MPVRSLTSSVLRWPEAAEVMAALAAWFEAERGRHPELVRFGLFGSYGRGRPAVGSDLDLVAVVTESSVPFAERARSWPTEKLPLPAELLIYTVDEWRRLPSRSPRFANALEADVVWLWPLPGSSPGSTKS